MVHMYWKRSPNLLLFRFIFQVLRKALSTVPGRTISPALERHSLSEKVKSFDLSQPNQKYN